MNSEVFTNMNPWVLALLSLLYELKQKPDLKLRIAHEIDSLYKIIKISPDNFPQTSLLTSKENRQESIKEYTPTAEVLTLTTEHRSMASLPEYVQISPKLAELYPEQELKKIISASIEQVIKEIIQPIVQRNVNIALITTKELVLKDFTLEQDVNKLQQASNWVVQSLAGSLARVTSREPFRVHLVSSLNEVFKNKNISPDVCKQIVDIASLDNLELGCGLIAKIVIEKALNDVNHEESIKEAIQKRRNGEKNNEDLNSAIPMHILPEILKPKASGLSKEQFQVYKDFISIIDNPKKVSNAAPQEIKTLDTPITKFDEQIEQAESIIASRSEIDDPEVQQAITNVINSAFSAKSESVVTCASKLFKRMYTNELLTSFYIQILQNMKEKQQSLMKDITDLLIKSDDHKKFYWPVTSEIIKADIVFITEIDKTIGKAIETENPLAIQFSYQLIREFLIKNQMFTVSQFLITVTVLRNLREKQPKNEELLKILSEIPEIRTIGHFNTENDKQRELIIHKFEE